MKYLIRLGVKERLQDKLKDFFYLAIAPKETERKILSLPAILYPLYYIIRPIRLFITYKPGWEKICRLLKSVLPM